MRGDQNKFGGFGVRAGLVLGLSDLFGAGFDGAGFALGGGLGGAGAGGGGENAHFGPYTTFETLPSVRLRHLDPFVASGSFGLVWAHVGLA